MTWIVRCSIYFKLSVLFYRKKSYWCHLLGHVKNKRWGYFAVKYNRSFLDNLIRKMKIFYLRIKYNVSMESHCCFVVKFEEIFRMQQKGTFEFKSSNETWWRPFLKVLLLKVSFSMFWRWLPVKKNHWINWINLFETSVLKMPIKPIIT